MHVFNLSIYVDLQPAMYLDIGTNDQESMIEFIVEQVFCVEDLFPEGDEGEGYKFVPSVDAMQHCCLRTPASWHIRMPVRLLKSAAQGVSTPQAWQHPLLDQDCPPPEC